MVEKERWELELAAKALKPNVNVNVHVGEEIVAVQQ
jgi:hypothetical protein